jgi:hypothetical protein
VALVEQTLKTGLPNDYLSVYGDLKSAKSLSEITDKLSNNEKAKELNTTLGGTSLARLGVSAGLAFKPAGITIWQNLMAKNFSILSPKNQWKLFKDGLSRMMKGDPSLSGLSFGARLKGCALGSGAFFLLLEGIDLINGDLSLENTAINAGRATVGAISTSAGSAVTSYLASAGVGALAGPVGIAAGIAVSYVGNKLIDRIVDLTDGKTDNGLPEKYEPTTYEDVIKEMKENGYLVGTPKLYPDESIYDTVNELYKAGIDEEVIRNMVQGVAKDCNILDAETQELYARATDAFKTFIIDYPFNIEEVRAYWTEDRMVNELISKRNISTPEEELFVRELYEFYLLGENTTNQKVSDLWKYYFYDNDAIFSLRNE